MGEEGRVDRRGEERRGLESENGCLLLNRGLVTTDKEECQTPKKDDNYHKIIATPRHAH